MATEEELKEFGVFLSRNGYGNTLQTKAKKMLDAYKAKPEEDRDPANDDRPGVLYCEMIGFITTEKTEKSYVGRLRHLKILLKEIERLHNWNKMVPMRDIGTRFDPFCYTNRWECTFCMNARVEKNKETKLEICFWDEAKLFAWDGLCWEEGTADCH